MAFPPQSNAGDRLASPPPSPVNDPGATGASDAPDSSSMGTSPMGRLLGSASNPGVGSDAALGMGGDPQTQMTGLVQLGQQIAQSLDTLASAAPVAAQECAAARQLLMQGLAKLLQAGGGSGSMTSPAGTQFPGGGFTAPRYS